MPDFASDSLWLITSYRFNSCAVFKVTIHCIPAFCVFPVKSRQTAEVPVIILRGYPILIPGVCSKSTVYSFIASIYLCAQSTQ